MAWTTYRGRKAFQLENQSLRIVVTTEGGHLAQVVHKATGVSPLWVPPWPTIEPSRYTRETHPEYGDSQEAPLLAGILGHSICLDTYGAPSLEEAAVGMPIHGEAPIAAYQLAEKSGACIRLSANLPLAQLSFEREIELAGEMIVFREAVTNHTSFDRPIAWTQHVTMGPPFVKHGRTEFRMPATRSSVIDADFGGAQRRGAEFQWPMCPLIDGGIQDLRRYPDAPVSAGFTTHLIDPDRQQAFFTAWSPESEVAFGYVWNRSDFPWVCRWEENRCRQSAPWNGETITCAFEFGVSPTIESRRAMVERGRLFDEPTFRWLAARGTIQVSYCAFMRRRSSPPESVVWDGKHGVQF